MQKQNRKTIVTAVTIIALLALTATAWIIWLNLQPTPHLSDGTTVRRADIYVDESPVASRHPLYALCAKEGLGLTEDEYRMIAITAVNADFTSDDSMLAVIRVIYNRVHDSRFPDTVQGVLTQKGQFENCDKVAVYAREAYDYEHIKTLVDRVWIDGADPFEGANALFYAAAKVNPARIARGLTLVCECGQSNFYSQE